MDAEPASRKVMMLSVAEYHGKLHAADIGPDRVPHLTSRGTGPTAIERELSWWFEEARLASPTPDKLTLLRSAQDRLIAAQPDPFLSAWFTATRSSPTTCSTEPRSQRCSTGNSHSWDITSPISP